VAQRLLPLNLSPDARKSQNSLLNSLIAGKAHGDGRDQHCVASQAVEAREKSPWNHRKGPQLAGFCDLTRGLRSSEFAKSLANLPKVSGSYRKYSRFWETGVGDRFDRHWVARAAVNSPSSNRDEVFSWGQRDVGP
jgi:hypothetical protein